MHLFRSEPELRSEHASRTRLKFFSEIFARPLCAFPEHIPMAPNSSRFGSERTHRQLGSPAYDFSSMIFEPSRTLIFRLSAARWSLLWIRLDQVSKAWLIPVHDPLRDQISTSMTDIKNVFNVKIDLS